MRGRQQVPEDRTPADLFPRILLVPQLVALITNQVTASSSSFKTREELFWLFRSSPETDQSAALLQYGVRNRDDVS